MDRNPFLVERKDENYFSENLELEDEFGNRYKALSPQAGNLLDNFDYFAQDLE